MERVPDGFVNMVKADPLFAAEGMDLERGEATLDAIEDTALKYEHISATGSIMTQLWYLRHPLARSALPIPFLRSFMRSERVRRIFLSHPSSKSAKALLSSWDETQKRLLADIRNFSFLQRTLYRLESRRGPLPPICDKFGRAITRTDVERQLGRLQENAEALKKELAKRFALLEKRTEYRIEKRAAIPSMDFIEADIPEKYKKIHEMEVMHGLPFRHGTILERHGPLLHTLEHFDAAPTPHIFMVYIVRNDTDQIASLKVMAVDEYRFRKTGIATDDWHIYSQSHLLGKGIPYWYQPATNLYTMRDQQYWAQIATIIDVRRRPWLDIALVHAQKCSLFDLLLGACFEDHQIVLAHLKDNCRRGTYTPDLRQLWALVRTHPSIYFMPFNDSVWRLPEPLSFLGTGLPTMEGNPYLSADTVVPELSPAEFELVMRAGRIREEARDVSFSKRIAE